MVRYMNFPEFSLSASDIELGLPTGETLPTHKRILKKQSRYFEAMFSGAFIESGQQKQTKEQDKKETVQLNDVTKTGLEFCLSFIYSPSSTIKDLRTISEDYQHSYSDLSDHCNETLLDIWHTADMLQMSGLPEVMEFEVLVPLLCPENLLFVRNMALDRGRLDFISRILDPLISWHLTKMDKHFLNSLEMNEIRRFLNLRLWWGGGIDEATSNIVVDWCNGNKEESETVLEGICSSIHHSLSHLKNPAIGDCANLPLGSFLAFVQQSVVTQSKAGARPQWADHLPSPYLSICTLTERRNDVTSEDDLLSTVYEMPRSRESRSWAGICSVGCFVIFTGGGQQRDLEEEAQESDAVVGEDLASSLTTTHTIKESDDKNLVLLKSVIRLSLHSLIWDVIGELNFYRYRHAIVCDDDWIYVIGGIGGATKNSECLLLSVEKYSLSPSSSSSSSSPTPKWELCAPMLRTSYSHLNHTGHSASVNDSYIYVMGPEGDLQRYTTTKDRWDLLFSFDDNLSPSTVNFSFDLKQELLLCKCQIHQKEEDNRDKGYQLPPKLLCHGDLVMCFGGIFYNLCYDLNLKEMTLLSEAVTRVHNGHGGVDSDLPPSLLPSFLPEHPVEVATVINNHLWLGFSVKIGWNNYARKLNVFDAKFKMVERLSINSDMKRPWKMHQAFPIFVTRAAKYFSKSC